MYYIIFYAMFYKHRCHGYIPYETERTEVLRAKVREKLYLKTKSKNDSNVTEARVAITPHKTHSYC